MTEQDELDTWPDNIAAINVFRDMCSSWNVGFSGVIGLRWETFPVFVDLNDVPRDQWRDVKDCVRVMEAEAVRIINTTG